MGTFAETAIVGYRLSNANQGKQTSIFCFPLTTNERKFAVSVFQETNRIYPFAIGLKN
jgi:hypothetical protein